MPSFGLSSNITRTCRATTRLGPVIWYEELLAEFVCLRQDAPVSPTNLPPTPTPTTCASSPQRHGRSPRRKLAAENDAQIEAEKDHAGNGVQQELGAEDGARKAAKKADWLIDADAIPEGWPSVDRVEEEHIDIGDQSWYFKARRIVQGTAFDMLMGLVIIINLLSMFVEMEWRGRRNAYEIGVRGDDANWKVGRDAFEGVEYVFCTVYVIEMVAKIVLLRSAYLHDSMNIFDAVVVTVTSCDVFILKPTGLGKLINLSVARIIKMLRVVRVMKVLRFANDFVELRVLIRTLSSSIHSLVWAILLLACICMASGIFMVQMLSGFMEDDDADLVTRKWVYERFGSSGRATYTMFEATFTGSWVTSSRPLIEKVHPLFAIFWVVYIVAVNFAVMRVIAALFLKQTMAVAAVDAEKMQMAKAKEREKYAASIREVFLSGDIDKDGTISPGEFMSMIQNPNVGEKFIKLELELVEVVTLFHLLSHDDGKADYMEFVEGALKMKNSARNIDIIQILHEQQKLMHTCEELRADLDHILSSLEEIDACRRE